MLEKEHQTPFPDLQDAMALGNTSGRKTLPASLA